MATYPIKNTKTGETKEVVMSVNDWDQWKIDNLIGFDISPQITHQVSEKLASGKTN